MGVSKRLRFEILRRDNQRCRYCGSSASELVIDHVVPESLGGPTEPNNLVAACRDCNAGKTSVAPGDGLVADVNERALRWRDAIRTISESDRRFTREESEFIEAVDVRWRQWHHVPSKEPIERPDNWTVSLRLLCQRGLPEDEAVGLIDGVMERPKVKDQWRYFMGCCWNRLNQLEERAAALLQGLEDLPFEEEDFESDNPTHSFPCGEYELGDCPICALRVESLESRAHP